MALCEAAGLQGCRVLGIGGGGSDSGLLSLAEEQGKGSSSPVLEALPCPALSSVECWGWGAAGRIARQSFVCSWCGTYSVGSVRYQTAAHAAGDGTFTLLWSSGKNQKFIGNKIAV